MPCSSQILSEMLPEIHRMEKCDFRKPIILSQIICTTIHRYPIFSTRYSVMCKVYTGYCGTSEIEHGLYACTVDNPLAKARGLSLRTGAQTMLYLSLNSLLNRDSFSRLCELLNAILLTFYGTGLKVWVERIFRAYWPIRTSQSNSI